MTGLVVLDVIIGLVFIYLLYSLLATIIQEIIATILNFRAKNLSKAIKRMLDDGNKEKNIVKFSTAFYEHPLITYLSNKKGLKPSYLTAQNFSKVVIDLLRGKDIKLGDDSRNAIDKTLEDNKNVTDTPNTNILFTIEKDTLQFLNSLWVDAQGDVEKFKLLIENWFENSMERATEWYKQNSQLGLFFIGFFIAFTFNVDTFFIVRQLSSDPKLREQIVNQADAFVKEHPNLDKQLEEAKKDSLGNDARKSIEQLKARRDTLMNQATTLVKNDINKLNNLLALGWPVLPDSVPLLQLNKQDSIQKISQISYRKILLCHDSLPPKDSTWSLVYYPKSGFERVLSRISINKNNIGHRGCNSNYTMIKVNNDWWEQLCYVLSQILSSSTFGWLITAIAISFGAPFWFDLLNKLVQLRGAIKPSSESQSSVSSKKSDESPIVG